MAIAEASYRLDIDDQAWLEGILDAAAPMLDEGSGVIAAVMDNTGSVPAPSQILAAAFRGATGRAFECFTRLSALPPSEDMRRRFIETGAAGTLAATIGPDFSSRGGFGEVLAEHGYADGVFVLAGDVTGVTCVLASPRKARAIMRPRAAALWSQAAAHVASGHRLRTHLRRAAGDAEGEGDALLGPDGKVHHAAAEATSVGARNALRAAVLRSEKARGPLRRLRPEQALGLWQALVAGRWSLIDRFDSDGRRFLVARRNEPLAAPRAPLSQRECQVAALVALGHSNKLISYELGLAASTVATHLAGAMSKLGIASRVELVQLFGAGR